MIEGTIETLTSLHIGDGGVLPDGEQEVARVVRDAAGHPYLPGSGLRGFVRSCAERLFDREAVNDLFGYQEERTQGIPAGAVGGLLHVWDAPADSAVNCEIQHHVVINRRTRAAAEHLLFAEEVVPEGTRFQVVFVIEGVAAKLDHVALLLGTLNHLHDCGQRLGAGTADNMGKVRWSLSTVKELNGMAIQNWLKDGGQLNRHLVKIETPVASEPTNAPEIVYLNLELQFEDLFLVQEVKEKPTGEGQEGVTRANTVNPIKKSNNRPYLPSSSLLGALRSHCERIARTQGLAVRDVALPAKAEASVTSYDAVDLLFGGVGFCASLRVESDFVGARDAIIHSQSLVAIDRFTGGAAESMLFEVRAFDQPRLKGCLSLDKRAFRLGKENCAVATNLIAVTLRELAKGWLPLGYGTSKGFGHNQTDSKPIEGFIDELTKMVSEEAGVC